MSYMVVRKHTDIDDVDSVSATASTIQLAVEIYDKTYGLDNGDEMDVYHVSEDPISTVRVNRQASWKVTTVG